jgi:transposase-like protein
MSRRDRRARNPLFAKCWFGDDVIVLCVRWYLLFKLSYRDLSAIMSEFDVAVAPCTILRWVIRYSEDFVQRCSLFERPIGRS